MRAVPMVTPWRMDYFSAEGHLLYRHYSDHAGWTLTGVPWKRAEMWLNDVLVREMERHPDRVREPGGEWVYLDASEQP